MSKYQELKNLMVEAMKAKKPEVSILRVVLGELQRSQKEPDDNTCERVIKKMIVSSEELYNLRAKEMEAKGDITEEDIKVRYPLLKELIFLKTLIPEEMDSNEMYSLLTKVVPQIQEAKSDGHAIGIAMKCLKEVGKTLNTDLVSQITKNIRHG